MNKWGIAGIVVACLAAGFVIGVFAMPGRDAQAPPSPSGGQKASPPAGPSSNPSSSASQPPAPDSAIDPRVRPIIEEEVRKAAKEMAARMLARPRDSDIGIQPVEEPEASAAPVLVKREAFEITLPPGSVVKPPNPKYGRERLVSARVPGHGTLSILVVDEKERASDAAEGALNGLKENVRNTESMWNTALGWLNFAKVDGFRATIEGEAFGFEVGVRTGSEKAVVVIVEYPIPAEGNKNEVVPRLREALLTLNLKQ